MLIVSKMNLFHLYSKSSLFITLQRVAHERESGLRNPENFYLTESGIQQYLLLNPESLVLEVRNTF